jgi:hypothetical protein
LTKFGWVTKSKVPSIMSWIISSLINMGYRLCNMSSSDLNFDSWRSMKAQCK